jgi:hypothetical protein
VASGARVESGQAGGPVALVGALAQSDPLDSKDTISDSSLLQAELIQRRGRKKLIRKHKSKAINVPKCFQFARAIMEGKGKQKKKGGLEVEGSNLFGEKGVGDLAVEDVGGSGGGCPATPSSSLHLILEESETVVPESPLDNSAATCRKELDATRLFNLQKTNGFNFAVVDNTMVSTLAVLEDIEVAKDGRRERERWFPNDSAIL